MHVKSIKLGKKRNPNQQNENETKIKRKTQGNHPLLSKKISHHREISERAPEKERKTVTFTHRI
jgi:hypothetical protein